MPAGPPNDQNDDGRPAPRWDDWPSFRRFVLEECFRLGAPRPDDGVLRISYIDRRAELARIDAWAEIHRHEQAQQQASTPSGPGGRRGRRRRPRRREGVGP